MTPQEYQERGAALWQLAPSFNENITHALFGLQTETAEVTDLFKKSWFTPARAKDFDAEKITDELGDILYYLVRIADLYQIPLEEIMEYNIRKLEERYDSTS